MWLLPTRGRPQMCQQTLDACHANGMKARGIVFVDGPTTPQNDEAYCKLRVPENWAVIFSEKRMRLAYHMNWMLKEYPKERTYSWIADDMVPETRCFDQYLEEAAGEWDYAHGRDDYITRNQGYKSALLKWPVGLTSGLTWGGQMLRALGWWAPPGLTHVGIDCIWTWMLQELGCCHYLPHVIIQHYSYRSNRRKQDVYDVTLKNPDDEAVEEDKRIYLEMKENKGYRQAVQIIQAAKQAAGIAA